MANAIPRKVTKKRMIEEEYTVQDGVTLELSDDEASWLCVLLGSHVMGDGELRDINSGIWNALIHHNYGKYQNEKTRNYSYHIKGSVDVRPLKKSDPFA